MTRRSLPAALHVLLALVLLVSPALAAHSPLAPAPLQLLVAAPHGLQINTFNGNLFYQRDLLHLPGPGLDLTLRLAYNSGRQATDDGFGHGWQLSANQYYVLSGADIILQRGDGNTQLFKSDGGGGFTAPRGVHAELTQPAAGHLRLTLRDGTRINFANAAHRHVTSIRDANGNTQTYSYSGLNLTQITDSAGRSITLTWAGGHLTTITDNSLGALRTVQLTHDASGDLSALSDVRGQTTTFGYSGHLLTALTTARGHTAAIGYAAPVTRAVVDTIVTPDTALSFAYDTASNTTTVSEQWNGGTRQRQYKYDAAGRIRRVSDPLGGQQRMTWDSAGNLLTWRDALNQQHSYSYDAAGNVLTHSDPLGHTTTYSYDGDNNLTGRTDPNGHTTAATYDANGNRLTLTNGTGDTTTFTHDAAGNVLTRTSARGDTTTYTYDADGNLATVTNPLAQTTTYSYDGGGRLTQIANPLGQSNSFSYDAAGHITQHSDPLANASVYTYDANGNLTSIIVGGQTTTYAYDAHDRLQQVTDALAGVTTYSYDEVGNLTAVQDANGHTRAYSYDAAGHLTTLTDALGNSETRAYDAAGRLTSRSDANGQTTSYSYDALGRLTAAQVAATSYQLSYSYDAGGRLTQADSAAVAQSFGYDAANRLTAVTIADGALVKTLGYSYDAAGNRATLTDPAAGITTYSYDSAERLVQLTNPAGAITTFGYDAAGRELTRAHATGITSVTVYDAAGQPTQISHNNTATAAPLLTLAYSYDAAGNVLTRSDGSGTTTYTYDALFRLMAADRPAGPDISYSYDAVGNRLSETATPGGVRAFSYDAADRLLSAGSVTYGVDAVGNRISEDRGGAQPIHYGYDPANRLVQVSDAAGATTDYSYDALGRLYAVTDPVAGESRQFHDVDNLLLETDAAGTPLRRYTATPALDDLLLIADGDTHSLLHDALGSVVGLGAAGPALAATYDYDPFGALLNTPPASGNPLRFSGRPTLAAGALLDLRARAYDPAVGRFLQPDPRAGLLDDPLSLNPFAYAQNNPATFSDTRGEWIWAAIAVVAVIVFVVVPLVNALIDAADAVNRAEQSQQRFINDPTPENYQRFTGDFVEAAADSTIAGTKVPGTFPAGPPPTTVEDGIVSGILGVTESLFGGSEQDETTGGNGDDSLPYGGGGDPNAIELVAFSATALAGGGARLAWETASEIDTAGFDLYRRPAAGGALTQVNAQLVAATGAHGLGAAYAFDDLNVPAGAWDYFLVELDTAGHTAWYGSVRVNTGVPLALGVVAVGSAGSAGSVWWLVLLTALVGGLWRAVARVRTRSVRTRREARHGRTAPAGR